MKIWINSMGNGGIVEDARYRVGMPGIVTVIAGHNNVSDSATLTGVRWCRTIKSQDSTSPLQKHAVRGVEVPRFPDFIG